MKVKVDTDTCIGCSLCVDTCPQVYRMEDNKAVIFTLAIPKEAEATCKRAADECPVTAIIVG